MVLRAFPDPAGKPEFDLHTFCAYLSESENKANLGAHAKLCGHFCCDSSLTINSHDGVADMG